MRGTPYFQAILMIVVFLLAGVPVYRLTRPAAPATAASAATADNTTADNTTADDTTADNAEAKPAPLELEVVFAPAPADFQIKNLDYTILAGHGPQARFTGRWTTAVPSEGVDLVFQAHWSASTAGGKEAGANPAAGQVTVRFPDGRKAEKSFWAGANGALDEVFTIPGAAATPAP